MEGRLKEEATSSSSSLTVVAAAAAAAPVLRDCRMVPKCVDEPLHIRLLFEPEFSFSVSKDRRISW